MEVNLLSWDAERQSFTNLDNIQTPDVIFYFGEKKLLHTSWNTLHTNFPETEIIGFSTGGDISGDKVSEKGIAAFALSFLHTRVRSASVKIETCETCYKCGRSIGHSLHEDDLKMVLVFADGMDMNICRFVEGLAETAGENVLIFGGLAGDGENFETTRVGLNEDPQENNIVTVAFYGDRFRAACSNEGGWRPYGPKRMVTSSKNNILYKVDNKPALDLYEKYLGEEAENLPASALLFPLSVAVPDSHDDVMIRSILSINRKEKSLVFAGNIPQDSTARFMRSTLDDLSGAASTAIKHATDKIKEPQLAFVISCIGRRMLMGQQVENEIEAIVSGLPPATPVIGFYAYGEICPGNLSATPRLQNETIAIALMSEE